MVPLLIQHMTLPEFTNSLPCFTLGFSIYQLWIYPQTLAEQYIFFQNIQAHQTVYRFSFFFPWRYFWSFLSSCSILDWRIHRTGAQLLTLTSLHHHFEKSLELSSVGLPVTWIWSLLSCYLPCLDGVHPLEVFWKGCLGGKYVFRFLNVQNTIYITHTLVYSFAGYMFFF